MSLGENIKMRREKLNMTQGELAEQVNVSPPMICQIERDTKTASAPLAKAIAKVLGCTLDDLVQDDSE